jgi:heme A synthase
MTGEGMAQDRQSSNPGWHLTRLLALLFFAGLFGWAAKWVGTAGWVVAAAFGFAALLAFIDMMRAHKVRTEIDDIIAAVEKTPKRQLETRSRRDNADGENWQ